MILDQLVEEAGDPGKGARPTPSFGFDLRKAGLPRKQVVGASLLPSTLVAIDDFLYINREMPFYISAAGLERAAERRVCQRLLPGIPKALRGG